MKKFLSFVLCAAMAFSVMSGILPADDFAGASVTVFAAEQYNKKMLPLCYSKLTKKEQEYYLKLRTAIIDHKKSLKIQMPLDTYKKLTDIVGYVDVMTDFNLTGFSTTRYSNYTKEITFQYIFDKETSNKILTKADEAAEKVISGFDDDMSQYDKALYIHDYIIEKTEYDREARTSNSIYGALYKKKAKCDGYAHAFEYICRKAGIDAVTVVGQSRSENHAWNKVCINKKWYNVDVTWDDPVSDMIENSSRIYFLLSDEEFARDHTQSKASYYIPEAVTSGKDYYTRNKLCAKSSSEAKSMIVSEIVRAAKNGESTVTIRLADEKTYKALKRELESGNEIFNLISKANKQTKVKLVTTLCHFYVGDDAMYSFQLAFYRSGAKISDYYKDPKSLDSGTIKDLKAVGLKAQ